MKVLDAGFVELLDTFGDDLTVVNAARVSFHKEVAEMTGKDEKLIKYSGRVNILQYIKNKPVKRGFKVFMLFDSISS